MNTHTYLRSLLYCMILLLSLPHTSLYSAPAQPAPQPSAAQPAAAQPGGELTQEQIENMSEEELLNLFMAQINEAIPEDEREAFWEEVARETERLEKETAHMTDEEKEKYLTGILSGEVKPDEKPTPQPEPLPNTPEKQTKKPKITLDAQQELQQTINSLILSLNSLINKTTSLVDFEAKFNRWLHQKRIMNAKPDTEWQDIEQDIHMFVFLLEQLREKDPKIGSRHLQELEKDKELVKELQQLETRLAQDIPRIEVSAFAIAKMSRATKQAAIASINALTQALYQIKLPAKLTTLLKKFEPIAKKIATQEERQARMAQLKSRRLGRPGTTRSVGRPESRGGFDLPSLDDYGIGGFGGGAPSRRAGGGGRPGGERKADQKKGPEKRGGRSGGGARGGASGGTRGGKKTADSSSSAKGTKKDTKKGGPTKTTGKRDRAKEVKHSSLKRNLGDFGKNLQDATTAIQDADELSSPEKLEAFATKKV